MGNDSRRATVKKPGALCILLLAFCAAAGAQEDPLDDILPAFKDQALVLDIVTRVFGGAGEIARGDESEIWHSVNSQVTLPGRAVSLKLVGANIIIAVQFTPFCRPSGEQLLVAQGQIWLEAPGKGIDYQTAFQTIPLSFGEEVRFLPLGPAEDGAEPMIEMRVVLRRYEEEELE